jgi:predicted RNA-binding protein Jag
MSETRPPLAGTASPDAAEKRDRAVSVIGELLRLMGIRAKLEAKDASDGGISVAVEMDGDLAGVQAGKRSHVIDALQFLANKIVNRPGAERRWIAIGVGSHPEPRPRLSRRAAPLQPASGTLSPPRAERPVANGRSGPVSAPPPAVERNEAALDPPPDAALSTAARGLASKAGTLGRFYAIAGMSDEDRSRVLKATQGVPGVKVLAEGDGRNRRLVFVPEKPVPMPKKTLPADDEAEE